MRASALDAFDARRPLGRICPRTEPPRRGVPWPPSGGPAFRKISNFSFFFKFFFLFKLLKIVGSWGNSPSKSEKITV